MRIKLRIQFWGLRRRKFAWRRPATGTQAHDLSREMEAKTRLRSALPQSPTSHSKFLKSKQSVSMSRVAEKIDVAN